MQLPEPIRKLSAAIGHARNFQWLIVTGLALVYGGWAWYSRYLVPMPIGKRLLTAVGTAVAVAGGILGLLQLLFPGPPKPAVEAQPVAPALPPPPLEQTTAEKSLVQDYRTMWNRHGLGTISGLFDILRDATWALKEKYYWASLLTDVANRLERAVKTMSAVVAFDNTPQLAETREAFNEVYQRYTEACGWVAKIQEHEDVFEKEPYRLRLAGWKQAQRRLSERLRDMDQIPEHHQTMKIYLKPIANDSLRRLMQDAEGE